MESPARVEKEEKEAQATLGEAEESLARVEKEEKEEKATLVEAIESPARVSCNKTKT